jgi:hypothetical protein
MPQLKERERDHLEDQGVDGRIIFKILLKKQYGEEPRPEVHPHTH